MRFRLCGVCLALSVSGSLLLLRAELTDPEIPAALQSARSVIHDGERSEPAPASDYQRTLQTVRRAQELQIHGRYQEAESLLRATWDGLRTTGVEDLRLAIVLSSLGGVCRDLGNYAEAERLLERAAHLVERESSDAPEFIAVMNDLVMLYVVTGQSGKAETLHRRIEKLMGGRQQTLDRRSAMLSESLAAIYLARRRYRDAEPLYEQALAMWRSLAGPESYEAAVALNNIAVVYGRTGRYDVAIAFFERAREILERTAGKDHYAVAACLASLADVYSGMRQFARAIDLQKLALTMVEAKFGLDHPLLADLLLRHARTLGTSGDKHQAGSLQRRASAILATHRKNNQLDLVIDIRTLSPNPAGQQPRLR